MITVAVQQEQRLFREGLAMVLAAEKGLEVIGTARTGRELLELAARDTPDTAIVEADRGPDAAVRLVTSLRAMGTTRVLGLYQHLTRAQARELHGAGAALIDRVRGVEPVLEALRGNGPIRLDVTALERCGPAPCGVLTAREIEVLGFVGKGITSKEISDLLGISRKTVENHKQRTFQKLGVQNQAHAVSVAMRRGLFAGVASGG